MDFFNKSFNTILKTTGLQNKEEGAEGGEEGAGAGETTTNESGNASTPISAPSDAASRKESTFSRSSQDPEGAENKVRQATEQAAERAKESAKYLGSFMYNLGNKAAQTVSTTVSATATKIKNTGILADFTKEQQEFIKDNGGHIDVGEPPWKGCDDEESVKEQILSLSQDKRSFVRAPPSGVQFEYDPNTYNPIALAMLKEDPNLGPMRYELVPKLVKEEEFWRNYFYRVSIIKQSTQLRQLKSGSISAGGQDAKAGWASSRSSSGEGPDDPNESSPTQEQPEFASDAFQSTEQVTASFDIDEEMRKLGLAGADSTNKDDKQWEEEVNKDLQEFEVIPGNVTATDEAELENELNQLDIK